MLKHAVGGYRESGFGRDGGREGMYEYLKPKWMKRPRPSISLPISSPSWKNYTPSYPQVSMLHNAEKTRATTIDKTWKMYIGGAQCRPDAPYSRSIVSAVDGHILAQVGEGNRKDIRNAVEAAHRV